MSKAEQAAFFNCGIGASVAASFTTDKIRDEPSCEVSFQLIPGRSIMDFELFPLDCDGIVRRGKIASDTTFNPICSTASRSQGFVIVLYCAAYINSTSELPSGISAKRLTVVLCLNTRFYIKYLCRADTTIAFLFRYQVDYGMLYSSRAVRTLYYQVRDAPLFASA